MTRGNLPFPGLLFAGAIGFGFAAAQEQGAAPGRGARAEINLRKSVEVRDYQGRQVSGEERQIGRGDSLWRILIEEKGVPERRFRSYLVVIHGLNPQLRNLDTLRVGDKIFIPLRFDDLDKEPTRAEAAAADPGRPGSAQTEEYRVKAGEHLYRILRDRFKAADERKIAQYYSLVKDLNPERKNWDSLPGGEIIRLPVGPPVENTRNEPRKLEPSGAAQETRPAASKTETKSAAAQSASTAQTISAPAREKIDVLLKVASIIGNESQNSGEEVVSLPEGAVRLDRRAFPVIYNPVLRQRVVIDPGGKIPASLKSKLNDPRVGTPVVPIVGDLNVAEAVRQLLAGVGYQSLPTDNPVVIQDAGVAVEARGDWIFLAPAINNRTQEVIVVNLTERPNQIPDYLTAALAKQGLYLREAVMPATKETASVTGARSHLENFGPPRELPKDRREFIDALLLAFQIPFGVAETVPVDLGGGLRIDTLVDRMFEIEGKRTAILFRRVDPMVRKALVERHGITSIEIEVNSTSSKEIIGRLLELVGDRAVYGEHRFSAADGAAKEQLTLKAWGFNLPERSMFLTDRQIPTSLHRFFFEKGLDIVYFR